MKKLLLLSGLVFFGLLRWLPLHIAKANEKGSPVADEPFLIEKPTTAQAIYARLDSGKSQDFYILSADKATDLRAILLIPATSWQNGLRATFTLYGAGLPAGGAIPKASEGQHNIAGRDYMIVRSHVPALPETGEYHIVVEREAGEGTYCLCVGTENEGLRPDPDTRAKISAMLALDE
jgi:hypothetical protein